MLGLGVQGLITQGDCNDFGFNKAECSIKCKDTPAFKFEQCMALWAPVDPNDEDHTKTELIWKGYSWEGMKQLDA